jgi:SAM-dependent methyltransferase
MITEQPSVNNNVPSGEKVEHVPECLVCGALSPKFLFQGKDDRYSYPESFPVVRCPHCGLVYLQRRPQETIIGELYKRYYSLGNPPAREPEKSIGWKLLLKKSFLMNLYHWLKITREDLYNTISFRPGIRILDIGSGAVPECAPKMLRDGVEWMAVEVDERKCRLLEDAGLTAFCGTLEEFQITQPFHFDYIILSQVLEHVYQPRRFLSLCRALLRSGGKIILSCPNYDSFLRKQHDKRWLHWHIPYHVAHYSHSSLTFLASPIGLNITKFYTYTPVTWFFAQKHLARGKPYDDKYLARHELRWGQRLLDLYLAPQHHLHKGDALFAELQISI